MTQDKYTGLTLQGAIAQVLAEAPAHEPVDPTPDAEATEGEAYHRELAWWQAAQMLKGGLAGAPAPDKAGDREGVARETISAIIRKAIFAYRDAQGLRFSERTQVLREASDEATDAILAALSTGNEEPGREELRKALNEIDVHEEAGEYELRADGDYKPNEFEQQLLEDFGCGLIALVEEKLSLAAPAPPVSPEPDSRAGVDREAVEAASAAFYDAMIGAESENWPHHLGWKGKDEPFKERVRGRMRLALEAAAIQSAPTASAAAGPAGAWKLGSKMAVTGNCDDCGANYCHCVAGPPTPDPHPVPAMEGFR